MGNAVNICMKRWLTTHTNHIHECCRQANHHTAQSTRDIRTYIPQVPAERHNCTPAPTAQLRTSLIHTRQSNLVAHQQPIQKYFQPISPTAEISTMSQSDTNSAQSHPLSSLATPCDTFPDGSQSLSLVSSRTQTTIQTSLTKYFALKKNYSYHSNPTNTYYLFCDFKLYSLQEIIITNANPGINSLHTSSMCRNLK